MGKSKKTNKGQKFSLGEIEDLQSYPQHFAYPEVYRLNSSRRSLKGVSLRDWIGKHDRLPPFSNKFLRQAVFIACDLHRYILGYDQELKEINKLLKSYSSKQRIFAGLEEFDTGMQGFKDCYLHPELISANVQAREEQLAKLSLSKALKSKAESKKPTSGYVWDQENPPPQSNMGNGDNSDNRDKLDSSVETSVDNSVNNSVNNSTLDPLTRLMHKVDQPEVSPLIQTLRTNTRFAEYVFQGRDKMLKLASQVNARLTTCLKELDEVKQQILRKRQAAILFGKQLQAFIAQDEFEYLEIQDDIQEANLNIDFIELGKKQPNLHNILQNLDAYLLRYQKARDEILNFGMAKSWDDEEFYSEFYQLVTLERINVTELNRRRNWLKKMRGSKPFENLVAMFNGQR